MFSRSHRSFAGTLAAVAAAGALAAPAVQARPLDAGRPHADVASPPSSIAAPAGREYQEVRMAARQDQDTTPVQPRVPVESVPAPGGFDWLSAGIGAVVASSLALLAWAAAGIRRPVRRAARA
jgi:hypothetical protein